MSLIASASPWNSDETINKKRQSTMRKTIKLRSSINEDISAYNDSKTNNMNDINNEFNRNKPTTIGQQEEYNTTRNKRVNDLLNKITSVDNDDSDNNKMGNFKPLSHPSINVKKDMGNFSNDSTVSFNPTDNVSNVYSNYNKSYIPPNEITNKPYYKNQNIVPSSNHPSNHIQNNNINHHLFNEKMMEKLNYMIHLLEETKKEKTSNITEEFILYTFLGVFVIFVVDSFSRGRKYTR